MIVPARLVLVRNAGALNRPNLKCTRQLESRRYHFVGFPVGGWVRARLTPLYAIYYTEPISALLNQPAMNILGDHHELGL